MTFHQSSQEIITIDSISPNPSSVLVGVCSCRNNSEQRKAIRETWASKKVPGVTVLFFVGEGDESFPEEPDTISLSVPDDYDHLPAKVQAFFKASLLFHDFGWLFKCDDDTYVAVERMLEFTNAGYDLVGNEFIITRGSPSGGAGYLLSRQLVSAIANEEAIPKTGDEDIHIGKAAMRLGAIARGTQRFCWKSWSYPRLENNIITSHYCSPQMLRAIHSVFHLEPVEELEVVHQMWSDTLLFYSTGIFARKECGCLGTWKIVNEVKRLEWFEWDNEFLQPIDDSNQFQIDPNSSAKTYLCVPVESI